MCFAPPCVHFFDISTAKSGPNVLVCFLRFDFEMCFAPQRRALFRHRNFQKWSDAGVFCTCWLWNVLRATAACTFSTSQLPKVVRRWCVLYILTSKCASRHNGVQFFDISTAKSGPNVVCFLHFDFEMCFAPQRRAIFHLSSGPHPPSLLFDPPEPQIIGKTLDDDGWWWTMMDDDGWWWMMMDDDGWWWMMMDDDGWWWMMMDAAGWWWMMMDADGCWWMLMDADGSWWMMMDDDGCWWMMMDDDGWWWMMVDDDGWLSYLFTHLHLLSSYALSLLLFSLLIFLFSLPLPCSAFHLSILSEVWLLNFLRLSTYAVAWYITILHSYIHRKREN